MPDPIVAGMAVQPARFPNLAHILKSILPQVDNLYVYVNGYSGPLPSVLTHPKVVASVDLVNRGSQMKFWGVSRLLAEGKSAYYLSLDDDVLVEDDYARVMVEAVQAQGNKIIACLHSHSYKDFTSADGIWGKLCISTGFWEHLTRYIQVIFPGTGSSCFHIPSFVFTPDDVSPYRNMDDTLLGIKAMHMNIPVYSIPRREHFISTLPTHGVQIWTNDPVPDIEKVIGENLEGLRALSDLTLSNNARSQ